MRAAVCREFGAPLTIEEVTIADPGHAEVLIDVAACAVCHSDISYMDGRWGGQLPAIFGHEASGTVKAVGLGVTEYSPGDSVVVTLVRSCGTCYLCAGGDTHLCQGDFRLAGEAPLHSAETGEEIWQAMSSGAFAQQVVVHQSQIAKVPASIPKTSAALIACGVVTGFGAVVKTAAVPAGASVAVVGTGGVGINCIQGAIHAGADPVIAVDIRDDKLDFAMSLGATSGVNSATEDARSAVMALTGGRGADYVFVAVGSSRAVEASLRLLRPGGTLTVVGLPASGDLLRFDTADFATAGLRLIGSKMGSVDVAHDVPLLAAKYGRGELVLDKLVTNTYRLDDINEAIASAKSGEVVRNVIVFD